MVRTRNKTEDITSSTKKTRGKRNIENEDAAMFSVKSKKSGTTETPGEERRATRNQNRRNGVTKNSGHSDIENEVEATKISSRRKNDAKIENLGTRSATHQRKNFTGELSTATAISGDNISARSSRRKKKDEVLPVSDDNNSLLLSTQSKSSTVKTAEPEAVITTKNEVQREVDKNENTNCDLISEDDSSATIQSTWQSTIGDVVENSLLTEDESADNSPLLEETSTKLRNRRAPVLRKIIDTPKKPSPHKQPKTRVKQSTDIVTPQSSPIVVNLTPHRSSKTPKKSPVNLSSPKTHSQSSLHLSKTPRKLPISIDSPAASEKSSPCPQQNHLKTQLPNSRNIPIVILCDIQQFSTNARYSATNPVQTLKSPTAESNSTICNSSEIEPKISKSKSPVGRKAFILASKIKKSVKIRNNISPRKSPKRTSMKASTNTLSDGVTAEMLSCDETPVKTQRVETGKRFSRSSGKLVSLSNRSPELETQADTTESATKISAESEDIASNAATITSTKTPSNINITLVNGESPKRLRSSARKRSPITSSGTPLRPIPLSNDESLKSSVVVPNLSDGSTPATIPTRNLIRRSLNLTPDFKMLSSNSTSSPMQQAKSKVKNSKMSNLDIKDLVKSKTIRDESVELLDASQLMNESDDICENSAAKKDGTYEVPKGMSLLGEDVHKVEVNETKEEDAEVTEGNATYEVTEPKTPSLQIKTRKRTMSVIEPSSCTPSARKRCRVRFASPVMSQKKNTMLKTPETLPKTPVPNRSASSKDRSSHNLRRRSSSLTSVGKEKPVEQRVTKRRSMSTSELNKKTPQLSRRTQESVNRLSRPRFSLHTESKPDIKTSSAKKAPNFAQIHEKKFAKMESLVDAKKRVAKRHLQLNRGQPASSSQPSTVNEDSQTRVSSKPSATQLEHGEYNRFGFKLRKKDAISAVTKKLPAKPRIENRRDNKRVVQAVRTNRRFELLMKMRKIDQ